MSNIICHPYNIVDESPLPLFGEIEATILINTVFLVLILFFTLFLISIFFIDSEKEKVKKPNSDSTRGGRNAGGGGKPKKDPSNFKLRSLSPNSKKILEDKGLPGFLKGLKDVGIRGKDEWFGFDGLEGLEDLEGLDGLDDSAARSTSDLTPEQAEFIKDLIKELKKSA